MLKSKHMALKSKKGRLTMSGLSDTCKVLAIVSGKGGAGKSTVACMLGVAFAKAGHKTLVIDADEGLRCLDLMYGMANEVAFDLGDLLSGNCEAKDAIKQVPNVKNLYLLPAPHSAGKINARLTALVDKLRPVFDRIIVDSTAGIGKGFNLAASAADEVIAVVGCDPVSIRDARNVCELLRDVKESKRRMIINRFDYKASKNKLIPHIDSIIDSTALQLIGIVPYDPTVALGAVNGRPITKGKGWRAFVRIAHRIDGKNINLPKLKRI